LTQIKRSAAGRRYGRTLEWNSAMSINPFAPSAPTFDEPLEMLAACHERIEEQLRTLEKLVEHLPAKGADKAAREAAAQVMRYFDTAGVHHHRDEDEDVFPLLRQRAAERNRPEVSAVMNDLEEEHATLDRQWSRVRERLDAVAGGRENALDREDVAHFAWVYRRHMDAEATLVLPFAREALSEPERAALGGRMAERRRIRA
jgi:hemerythrin-like domain-containing protein